jgi:acetyl-CoA acetyltransferase
MTKHDKLRQLLKEQIRKVILKEGFQAADNIYISMFEDNIVLTQSLNGSESDMGQKIEISMKDFPEILDGLFNLVPVNRIPANYRQSMIAKLSDKAIDQETDLAAEKPDKEFKGKKGKDEEGGGGEDAAPEEEAPGGEEEEAPAAGKNPFA